jgi:predicted nuclease of restriction endonuclease-like RecB superfamily
LLTSNLLRTKISRGKIRPAYVALDADSLALTERITDAYRRGIGKRKEELLERLKEIEDAGYDFKLVRGLSTLLERRSTFEAESEGGLGPIEARKAVFRDASRARASSPEEKKAVLQRVSGELGVSLEALERTLFSDIDDELILRDFKPFTNPDTLLKYYNLSLAQTLLFKSLRVEFTASGNWKNIFRNIKWLGLIYSVEREDAKEGQFRVSLDGPLSLFKMTERYGTSIAKLLPQITTADSWSIKAEILARSRGEKVYEFEADSRELEGLMADARWDGYYYDDEESKKGGAGQKAHAGPFLYDSSTEEKFSRSFLSYGTGWTLKREPEPLVAGTHVLIPDFSFEKDGVKKVYLEVVGFWTPQYLERKVAKLSSVASSGIDMIIAADESLACSKLERLKGKALVIYYKKEVPLKPIIEHLKEREASIAREEAEKLLRGSSGEAAAGGITLKGDVVTIEEIAEQKGVTVASVRMALKDFEPEGYERVGDRLFVSISKLREIDEKLSGVDRLTDALRIIEASGVKEEGGTVLEALGYTSTWEGMDMDKVRITKSSSTTSQSQTL